MMNMIEHTPVEHLPYAKELKTRLPYTESKLRTKISEAIGAGSACWENLEGAGVFKSDRAKQIAEELTDEVISLTNLGEPSLGCATTGELFEELKTRFEIGASGLDYRTVDDH